ncbi:hypothetical protein BZG36_02629 [Bifiguratus adelaidae]|uniref:RRM domain-containing protein n=1 Tax=Bifiguratus adelaidae TaxID=1938954 RepID=A0A261Y2K7_9FUNG|nr:hypothetical protein BZG36_02629 [Bifiguratus adelaidae]
MNVVKEIQRINQREAARGVGESGSWHEQYKDSAYIYVGGLPYELTEGDVICVFSQYGEILDINMVRDKKTGKGKGFAFLQYEDQRSTILAVDNLNGSKASRQRRTLRVDHCANYKQPKNEDGGEPEEKSMNAAPPLIQDDSEPSDQDLEPDDGIDPEDPMAEYLREQKKSSKAKKKSKKYKKHRHGHHEEGEDHRKERRSREHSEDVDRQREHKRRRSD